MKVATSSVALPEDAHYPMAPEDAIAWLGAALSRFVAPQPRATPPARFADERARIRERARAVFDALVELDRT